MKKGLIIVDFDGTLYNTRRANYTAYKEALREYGYKLDMEKYYKSYVGLNYMDFLLEVVGDIYVAEKVHEKKLDIYKNYFDLIDENDVLYDLLNGIRNEYFLVILTNASRRNCLEVLRHFRKDSFFDDIVTGDDVVKNKPNSEGFEKIMNKYNFPTERVLLIEDDIRNIFNTKIKAFVLNNYN